MGNNSEAAKESSNSPALRYFEVPSDLYRINETLEQETYLYYQGQYILYRSKGHRWKQEDVQKLLEFGVNHLFIKCSSDSEHQNFLDQKLSSIFDEPKIPVQQKAKLLYTTSMTATDSLYNNPEASESVKRSVTFVKHCINYLNKDRAAFNELLKLAAHQYSEHSHALHVSAYAITLGKQIGFRSNADSLAIGLGSMLHDIGKTKIDKRILEKPGPLDESERKEIEKHTEIGIQILKKHDSVPELSRIIVAQHHERPNGKGYPHGLKDDIHIYAKIAAIADCFDSLTTIRPYRKPLKSLDAVKYMLTSMKDDFEQSLLINFIRMLQE